MSLLLVRAVLGVALLVEAGFYIQEPNRTAATWSLGLSAIISGSLLLIGFLTPFVAIVVAAGEVGVVVSLLPSCTPNVFDSKAALIFALTMLLTSMGVGPGRFSVDARVFGRREIIIPPPASQSNR